MSQECNEAGSRLRIVTYCKDNIIGLGQESGISRNQTATIVVAFDFVICLIFIIWT